MEVLLVPHALVDSNENTELTCRVFEKLTVLES